MFLRIASLVTLASLSAAQVPSHISPAVAANILGNTNNTLPFQSGNVHYQQVHSSSSWSNPASAIFNSMSFRMARGGTGYTGPSVDMEVFMAQSPFDAANASTTFANNVVSGSETNVFVRRMINMPNLTDNSWAATIPFDNPYTHIASTHLSWRVQIYSSNVSTYVLDCWSDWRFGANTTYLGCQHPNATRNAQHNSTYRSPGNTSDFLGYPWINPIQPNVPALLMLGNSNSDFFGLPLPFDMTPIGAPGCQIVNNMLLALATLTQNTTFVAIYVDFPRDYSLVGQTYYSQYVFFEPNANPLGIFTSNGKVNANVPAPLDITRIYASGNPNATAGTLGREFALAVGLN